VGLSTQSLNQFAENVSKVEALCAEIASILRGLQAMAVSAVGAYSAQADAE
jgi:hypothetical protein